MTLTTPFQRCLSIDEQRLVLIPLAEAIFIRGIKRGILFILNAASGESLLAFRALNKTLASLPEPERVNLFVADGSSAKTFQFLSAREDLTCGTEPTYWIRDGRVLHKLSGYDESALAILREFTQNIHLSDE